METCILCKKDLTRPGGTSWSLNRYYGISGNFCCNCYEKVSHDSNGKPKHPRALKIARAKLGLDLRVVCAALRHNSGEILCGPRHFDGIMQARIAFDPFGHWRAAEQGFVDQRGNFLTREQAYLVAKAAGQIIRRCGGDEGTLFSENLY